MELLVLFNPWWKEGNVPEELRKNYYRDVFPELNKMLDLRQIKLITGLRRVGKSTLMYQLIQELIKKGIKAANILYFSFDEKVEELLAILEEYSKLTDIDWQKEECYLFFDEIQKLNDWSNKLKIIYDRFPNLRFIASGSSSFFLEADAKSNLGGRHFICKVNPLTFKEFLDIKKSKIDLQKPELWNKEIKEEFKDYLYAPFPEIITVKDLGLVKQYIRDNVLEKILRSDIPLKFENVNKDLLTALVNIFYDHPGFYINYDELSKDLGVSKNTLIEHVYYMECSYLVRRIKNYRPSTKSVSRKLQRIYPYHFSLGFGWTGNLNFETIVASFIDAEYYWRKNEKEVDFLVLNKNNKQNNKLITPIEVKESNSVAANKLKPLLYFLDKYKLKEGILIYQGEEEKERIKEKVITKMPIWKIGISQIGLSLS